MGLREYEQIGRVNVYREKPKKSLAWFWLAVILLALYILANWQG